MNNHRLLPAAVLAAVLVCACAGSNNIDRPLHISPASSDSRIPGWILMTEPVNGDTFFVDPAAVITEEHVIEAVVEEDMSGPSVVVGFNAEGASLLQDLTEARTGLRIAIVVHGELMSAPVVQEAVSGGRARITGLMTAEEAETLALSLAP